MIWGSDPISIYINHSQTKLSETSPKCPHGVQFSEETTNQGTTLAKTQAILHSPDFQGLNTHPKTKVSGTSPKCPQDNQFSKGTNPDTTLAQAHAIFTRPDFQRLNAHQE